MLRERYRTIGFSLVVFLLLAGVVMVYLLKWEQKRTDLGYSAEARLDEFMVARIWLKRHGIETVDSSELQQLYELPPADGLLFLDANQELLNEKNVEDLFHWVESGGHLLVTMSNTQGVITPDGPLLQALAVKTKKSFPESTPSVCVPQNDYEFSPSEAESEMPWDSEIMPYMLPTQQTHADKSIGKLMRYPLTDGSSARFSINDDYFLSVEDNQWSLKLSNGNGLKWVGRVQGRGRIDVVTSLLFWRNHEITLYDHGWLLAQLVGDGPLWRLQLEEYPSLLDVLWQHMPELMLSMLLWLLLWGWYGQQRFGPLLPSPSTERRAWLEHIEACSYQLWRRGYGQSLLCQLAAVKDKTTLLQKITEIAGGKETAERMLAAALKNEKAFVQLAAALDQEPSKLDESERITGVGQLYRHQC